MNFDATIELRPSLEEDQEFLFQVFCSTQPDVMKAPLLPEQMEQLLQMQFRAQDLHYHTHYPDAQYDVVMLDRKRIGRLYVAKLESEFRILDIALLPEFRCKGIGTYLVGRVLEESQATNKPLRIHVVRGSREFGLYERMGFCQIDDLESHLYMECNFN